MARNTQLVLTAIPDLLIALVLLVALVLAIAKRRQLGATAGTLAAMGLGILVLDQILNILWYTVGFRLIFDEYRDVDTHTLITIYSIGVRVLLAVGLGLVIGAIFARRPTPQPSSPF